MVDENGQGELTPEGAGESAPVALMDVEGNFSETWRDSLDDDIKSEKCLESVKDIKSMARSYVHAQRMVGKEKVAIPGKESTDAEWMDFYKATGQPETPEDYGFAKPEDMPDEMFDADFAKSASMAIHELGMNVKQAQGLFKFWNDYAGKQVTASNQAQELENEELKQNFISKYGNKAEEMKHLGNVAVNRGSDNDTEFEARIAQKFGNDMDFVQLMVNLGGKFAEHKLIPLPGDATQSVADLQTEINEAMKDDAYMTESHPNHKHQVAVISNLYKKKAQIEQQTRSL